MISHLNNNMIKNEIGGWQDPLFHVYYACSLVLRKDINMIMDVYTHTIVAVGCIASAYYIGHYLAKSSVEDIVGSMLDTLEKEGFVETSVDKDGDKELVPISEVISKAVKESNKTTWQILTIGI